MKLSNIISEKEKTQLLSTLKDAGFDDAARVIDRLVSYAKVQTQVLEALTQSGTDLLKAEQTIHRSYPSTAVCQGGMGGSMVTPHCAKTCDNHSHKAAQIVYRHALRNLSEDVIRARNS